MILFLRIFFTVVILSMVAVTSWAGAHQSLGAFARSETFRDPWVIATLFDAYWAFLTFYVWVAWKEQSLAARVLWLIAIVLLGNMAMSAYMLAELFALRPDGSLTDVFTMRRPGKLLLPGILTAISVAVYALA